MLHPNTEHQVLTYPKESLALLKGELKEELDSLLEYWSTEGVDDKNGGFLGFIDNFGNKDYNATKGAVLNARILKAVRHKGL